MRRTGFVLRPFAAADLPPAVGITGSAERSADTLSVRYELRGQRPQFIFTAAAEMPARRDRLWEETCFELFLGPEHSDRYWEFNLSPSGLWNVYCFESYRRGMREEQALTALPFAADVRRDSLVVSLEADLSALIGRGEKLQAGVAAVVRLADGSLTYWALAHPGPKPDFHRRDSFLLEV
ncbi:MAG: DOMON-like domain-containing protein [Nitrospiraceae bacterium]|nr:DOMON-like domain-containing protein [Nitrospiraceae bacterium]